MTFPWSSLKADSAHKTISLKEKIQNTYLYVIDNKKLTQIDRLWSQI